jgi:hypothetical protein
MAYISLTRGKFALIDDEDYLRISQWKWYAKQFNSNKSFYAARIVRDPLQKTILMHREILGIKESNVHIDHKNLDTLNNCRNNLRIATNAQNMFNRPRLKSNTSGFKGVTFRQKTNQWHARYALNGKLKHIGYFASKEDAAQAYALAAYLHYGEFFRIE